MIQADVGSCSDNAEMCGEWACCSSIQAFRFAPAMPLRHINHVVALAKGCFKGCTLTFSRPGKLANIDAGINATPEPATTHASIP